ncbi:thiamine-phosphate kinase [Methylocella sp.]|uniref:thiamine-phosphate kinase n=1 Tax=Methylocella sp. TaxID=1978226 RepID=UPI00378339B6
MAGLTEDELIARFFAPLAGAAGLGLTDDAAELQAQGALALTKDMLVAGVHFFADDPPDAIARKALRVNLSDLAAKGAAPLGFLLGLALPAADADWLERFAQGLGADAAEYAFPLLGGDTVATPGPLTISVTALGASPPAGMIRRGGVCESDALFLSGTVGDAALGLRMRLGAAQDRGWIDALGAADAGFLAERYLLPRPRLALRDALRVHARAAMDVSDGLAGDLAKMLRLDGLSAEIETRDLPLSAAAAAALAREPALIETILSGGDDYEILCVCAPGRAEAFAGAAARAGVAVKRIGAARRGEGAPRFIGEDGAPVALKRASFGHF